MDIPPELLELIFFYCTNEDATNYACTSKRAYASVKHLMWREVVVNFQRSSLIRNDIMENLRHARSLEFSASPKGDTHRLGLEYPRFLSFFKAHVLQRLSLSNVPDSLVVCTLDLLHSLTELNISSVSMSNWTCITQLSQLLSLCLSNCNVSDEDLEKISELKVHKLELVLCQDVTAKGLENITMFVSLTDLKFTDVFRSIHEPQFVCLYKLKQLVRLDLSDTDAGDLLFMHASDNYIHLRHLVLRFTRLSDAGLFYISKLPKLTYLNISLCNISDEGLSFVAVGTLRELDIRSCPRVTEQGIMHLIGNIKVNA